MLGSEPKWKRSSFEEKMKGKTLSPAGTNIKIKVGESKEVQMGGEMYLWDGSSWGGSQ